MSDWETPDFDWDEDDNESGNVAKIAAHGVTPTEAEDAILDSDAVPTRADSTSSERRRGIISHEATVPPSERLAIMSTDTRLTWPELKERELSQHPEVFATYDAFKRAVKAGQPFNPDRPFILVNGWNEVPEFASEDEEHEYWGTHEMGEEFFDGTTLDADERAIIARARRRRAQRAQG